jgi:translocation and assembly module TamA
MAWFPRFLLCALAGLGLGNAVHAATVTTELRGLDGELEDNVRASLSLVQAETLETVSVWRLRQWAVAAEQEIQQALQPFGYYSPVIAVRLEEPESDGAPWRAQVEVDAGEPVRIDQMRLALLGEAGELEEFRAWEADWPLVEGTVLRHPLWEQHLRRLDNLARANGFFDARYLKRSIEVQPIRQSAAIDLEFDGGPRYTIGAIDAPSETFNDKIMRRLTVLEPGQPFSSSELDRQREVLVRSGYFESVIVESQRDPDRKAVDLRLGTEARPPNTYRIQAGFGTDTGVRAQVGWQRHYLGPGGSRFDMALGAQQTDQEFVYRSDYQRPFGNLPGNFLTVGVRLQQEKDRFRFEDEDRIEPVFESFSGTRRRGSVTLGRLRERLLFDDFSPLQEHLFVTALQEQFDAFSVGSLTAERAALLEAAPGLRSFLDTKTLTLAAGAEWTLFRLLGEGFDQQGQYAQLRLLGASESVGSDVSFAQAYATARWHWRFLPRHKLLLRGELGYTAADTTEFDLALPGDPRQLDLNITSLPDPFRFRTGGDRTVRGYAFEDLSTNRNGANHLVVGSVEYEFNVFGDFSVAAFYDIGNAFNDWNTMELKAGTGIGVRWYTVIGPVQLDFARALADDSLRIHFTIGTKLL